MLTKSKDKGVRARVVAGVLVSTAAAAVVMTPMPANAAANQKKCNPMNGNTSGPSYCAFWNEPNNDRFFTAVNGIVETRSSQVCGVWRFHLQRTWGNTDQVTKDWACFPGNGASTHTAYKKNWTPDADVQKIWMQFIPDGGSSAGNPYIAIDLCC